MTLLPAPAHAGHWVFTATGSGSASLNGQVQFNQTWVAPTGTFTGSLSIPLISASLGLSPSSSPITVSASANATVTLKGTWTADGNSDDTPPPGVLFSETSNAQANFSNGNSGGPNLVQPGQANDGFGDPQIPFGAGVGTSATNGAKYVPSSGGTITTTLTLSASAEATQPANAGGGGAGAGVGPATISVHLQPYNFRSVTVVDPMTGFTHSAVVIDNPDATLSLSYAWSSTDGVLTHLTTCTVHENITWDTNTVGSVQTVNGTSVYVPPSPPAGKDAQGRPVAYVDPTVMGGPATSGVATDTFSPDSVYIGPYPTTSWWGDQVYTFRDTATGEIATPIPGPASGSNRITRAFTPTGTPSGKTGTLTITTRGHSAGPKNLN